jgi:hypothetical protein
MRRHTAAKAGQLIDEPEFPNKIWINPMLYKTGVRTTEISCMLWYRKVVWRVGNYARSINLSARFIKCL